MSVNLQVLSIEEHPDAVVNKGPFNFLEIIKANLYILLPVFCGVFFFFLIESCYLKQFLSLIIYKTTISSFISLRNHVNKVSKGYKIHLVINKNSN